MTCRRRASRRVVGDRRRGRRSLFLGDVKLSILVGVIVDRDRRARARRARRATGELSLAHAAFLGVGAFTGDQRRQPGRAVAGGDPRGGRRHAAAAATIAGLPSLRIRGLQVAITTLAFQEFAEVYLFSRQRRHGRRPHMDAADLPAQRRATSTCSRSALVALVLVVRHRVGVTKAGRAFLAVRDIDDRARCFGVEPGPSKLLAYAISGAIVGLAGSLFALKAGSISAKDPFLLLESLQLVAIVVVGGAGSAAGIVTAAVLIKGAPAVRVDDSVHARASRPDRADRVGGAARGRDRGRAGGHRRSVPRHRPAPRPMARPRARARPEPRPTSSTRGARPTARRSRDVPRPLSLRMPVPALLEAHDVRSSTAA